MTDVSAFLRDAYGDDDEDAFERTHARIDRLMATRGFVDPNLADSDPLRDVIDPGQPGASFWPADLEEHRRLCAMLEAELKAALATIRALHRCPHCDRPLTGAGDA